MISANMIRGAWQLLAVVLLAAQPAAAANPAEARIAAVAERAIDSHRLTALPRACRSLDVEPSGRGRWEVEVRERHGGTCGGDPATAPRLFAIRIVERGSARTLYSDAQTLDGTFERLGRR